MRVLNKILIVLFLLVTASLVAAYIFIQANGKRLLTEQISAVSERPVTLGDVRLSFPLGLRVDDFEMKGALKAKEVRIQLGILSLTQRTVHIASLTLIEPTVYLRKIPEEGILFGALPEQTGEPSSGKAEKTVQESPDEPMPSALASSPVNFIIDNLMIRNGELQYVDEYSSKSFELVVRDVELFAKDVSVPPGTTNIKYDLTAMLFESPLNLSGSKVQSNGWMNWGERNMDAELTISDSTGLPALKTALKSNNNDMTVKGKINMANLTSMRKQKAGEQASLEDMLFEGLRSSGVAIALDFQFKTKMDDFQLGTVAVSGNVDYQQPKRSVIQDFKNIGKQFEEIGKKLKEGAEKPAAPAVEGGSGIPAEAGSPVGK